MNNRSNNLSLPIRTIIYLVIILLFTAGAILVITANFFKNQTKHYHEDILERQSQAVENAINYEIEDYYKKNSKDNIYETLEDNFKRIADINKIDIVIYDLQGNRVLTTQPNSTTYSVLPQKIIEKLKKAKDFLFVNIDNIDDDNYKQNIYLSYNMIKDSHHQDIAILCIPYQSNQDFLQKDIFKLVGSYGLAFGLIILFTTLAVYFVTKKTLLKLWTVADRIRETEVITNNLPIEYSGNDEIKILVDSYNTMLQKLKDQSELIAKQEREDTWRDFAKQVAHEVKNPLTPMSLLIQNLLRKFDIDDPDLEAKTRKTGAILLEQIDIISAIAEAFSDFANMPSRIDEKIDFVDTIKNTLYIFSPKDIIFNYSPDVITMRFDRLFLNRIIINILKNAFQSIPTDREARVVVDLFIKDKFIHLNISDNGEGIPYAIQKSIFVPRFTTKTSGMGIGLAMVKKIIDTYDGKIYFETKISKGTTFFITFPYHNE